eukprot:255079_1
MVKKNAAKSKSKRPAAMPSAARGKGGSKKSNEKLDFKTLKAHLFKSQKRNFTIGGDLPPVRDLSRVMRWPRYIRVQRQRAILKQRLKIPPAIHQFSQTLDKNQASSLFRLMAKYRPETRKEKKQRLYRQAKDQVEEKARDPSTKPRVLKFGLKHITSLVMERKAKLVVIAHDVDPIELVVWLPALCRKMDVPYCIVKGKARLGELVYKKTCTAVAITDVDTSDKSKLDQLVSNFRPMYNDAAPDKKW